MQKLIQIFKVSLLFAVSVANAGPPPGDYLRWAQFVRTNLSHGWVNPPIGRLDIEIRRTEAYLSKMILELAGPDLKAKGTQWTVYLFQDKDPNAFVLRALYPEQAPFRGYIGDQAVTGPLPTREVAIFGVSTGLLELYRRSRARPAFAMGHELAHSFEGHPLLVDPFARHQPYGLKEEISHWWARQKNEVVADLKGIDRMAGRYPLDEAVEALTALLRLNTEAEHVVISAAGSHHHEGVRIATVQAYVEFKERSALSAVAGAAIPLPDDLYFRPGTSIRRDDEKVEALRPSLVRVVRDGLSDPTYLNGIMEQLAG